MPDPQGHFESDKQNGAWGSKSLERIFPSSTGLYTIPGMKKLASRKGFVWFLLLVALFRLLPTLVIYDGQGIFGQALVFNSEPILVFLFFILQFIGIALLLFTTDQQSLRELIIYTLLGSNILVLLGSFTYQYGPNPIVNIFYNIGFLTIGFLFSIAVSVGYNLVYLLTSSIINILLVVLLVAHKQSLGSDSNKTENKWDSVVTTSDQGAGLSVNDSKKEAWILTIPGNPDLKLATSELYIWAKKGYIKTDTLLTEISTNRVYPATQIPGVFSTRNYLLACLLSFFLGVFGIDRLYMGYIVTGLVKMFTFGGLGIWTLIDFIRILSRNLPDKNGLALS